jgi:transcriptional regulator with XRE-family HTH domain
MRNSVNSRNTNPADHAMSDFSENLRLLCGQKRSVSELCREIGVNRQQFGKYLSGATMPSAHNLRRICAHFAIDERKLFAPHESFRANHGAGVSGPLDLPWQALLQAFPGDRLALRRYLGFYHFHFLSASMPGMMMRLLVLLYEKDGMVLSRSVERGLDRARGVRQRTKYVGLASYRGDRLFVVEHDPLAKNCIIETILLPAHRDQLSYLRGMTFGVSWRPGHSPFASRAVWKRLKESASAREALADCGVFPLASRQIDPVVRNFIGEDTFPSGEELRHGDFF